MNWDKVLSPEILAPTLALSIPILAILLWGIKGIVRAMRGEPDDFEQWKTELEHLRARVDQLERSIQPVQQAPPNRY